MSRAVSAQTAKIIGLSGSRTADQRSAGSTRAKLRKLAALVVAASGGSEAVAPRAKRAAKPRPNVAGVLALGGAAVKLGLVASAFEGALRDAGRGQVPSFPPDAVDCCRQVLAVMRRYEFR